MIIRQKLNLISAFLFYHAVMTVYIEIVIFDNFILTYAIGYSAYRFLGIKCCLWRLLLSSAIGTAVAVMYPFISINAFIITVKIALAAVLSFILFFKLCNIFKGALTYLGATAVFGGVIFMLSYLLYGNFRISLLAPLKNISIGFILLSGWLIYLFIRLFFIKIAKLRDCRKNIFDFEVGLFGKNIRLRGFYDTGNRLYDNQMQLPVVIIKLSSVTQILDDNIVMNLMLGKVDKIGNSAHFVEFNTLSGKANKIIVIKPDSFRLYFAGNKNKLIDVAVGISLNSFKDAVKYDAILNAAIAE